MQSCRQVGRPAKLDLFEQNDGLTDTVQQLMNYGAR